MTVKVGDWVAFMRNGEIVYGRVEYIRKSHSVLTNQDAITTAGAVEVEDVLEVRSAKDSR
jgi:hypothetical protein